MTKTGRNRVKLCLLEMVSIATLGILATRMVPTAKKFGYLFPTIQSPEVPVKPIPLMVPLSSEGFQKHKGDFYFDC